MKLDRLRVIAEGNGGLLTLTSVGSAESDRAELCELLADIDAEIAKARVDEAAKVGQMNVRHFDGGGSELVKASTHRALETRVTALESTDIGTFNRLAVRVEHLERGQTNGVAYDARQDKRIDALEAGERELREHCQGNVPMSVFNDLKKRVDSLSSDMSSLENQFARERRTLVPRLGEDDAYKAWRLEPWPDGVGFKGAGIQNEYAFRAGFRAGRK